MYRHNDGSASGVRLQFGTPHNRGQPYRDRKSGHTLHLWNGRWSCDNCPFDVPANRYLTWRALLEDHRSQVGIR